jgi:amino acid adenylation domain-containing protein
MKLGDFDLLAHDLEKEQLRALIRGFNDNRTEYPRDKTVHALFREQAERAPDAVAIVEGDASYTYGELERLSNRLARLLVGVGVRPETMVGISLERPWEVAVALLGVLKAGAAYVPIDGDVPLERAKYLLQDTRARVLVFGRRWLRIANQLQWECPDLDVLFCADTGDLRGEIEPRSTSLGDEEVWDAAGRKAFDDISGGLWMSSYTGEWLSRRVMDGYGDNIRTKLRPHLRPDSRVLEIGVGSGISMSRLAPLVGFYLGTDLSGEAVRRTSLEVQRTGLGHVVLQHLPAHEVDRVAERDFDVVILNKVIDCFSGLNYLRDVLRKVIPLMKDRGLIFLGGLWDQEKKAEFVRSLAAFQRQHAGAGYRTQVDRSMDTFLSQAFLEDLRHDLPQIRGVESSGMLTDEESELSLFSFDAILHVDRRDATAPATPRRKHQLDLSALDAHPDAPLEELSGPDGLAYVIYTSGTSGRPKGVMIEHRSIARLVLNTNYIRFTAADRALQTCSLTFDPSTLEIWGMLLNGGSLGRMPAHAVLDTAEMARRLREHRVTTLNLVSSLFHHHVEADVGLFAGLKSLIVGGERGSPYHFNKVRQAHPGLVLINAYGPTENTTITTCFRVESDCKGSVPIGRPISNTEVIILDSNDELAPIGVAGEICAGGDGLARGYLNDPELTRTKFIPHPDKPGERLYRTGDLGRWRPDGTVEFLDRIDDQVKIRGFRIEPCEIETHLLGIEGVRQAVVLARGPNGPSKELVAYVTGPRAAAVDDLRAQLKTALPDYMVPSHFVPLSHLPLNANGKVDRHALPDPAEARAAGRKSQQPPSTETERRLVAIWEKVLGHRGIGVTDNFFESGGNSLIAAKLIAAIEKELGVVLPLTAIFKAATVRQLASLLLDYARFGVDLVDRALVRLSGAATGPNIFAFPPGTGDAAGFIQVAQALKPYTFYGFNFIEAESRIRDYADLITSVDPDGPYLFFGYSSGGNLAYHVAREIEGRGRRVSDIVMVDSARKFVRMPSSPEEVHAIADQFLNHESSRPYLTSAVLWEKAYRLIERSYAYVSAAVDHHVVDANIHVLASADKAETVRDEAGEILVSRDAWAQVTRGVYRVYQCRGDHNYMLYGPDLDRNIATIRAIYDAAAQGAPRQAVGGPTP